MNVRQRNAIKALERQLESRTSQGSCLLVLDGWGTAAPSDFKGLIIRLASEDDKDTPMNHHR